MGAGSAMRNEFTAILQRDGRWYVGSCAEIPGANGQGRTLEECRKSLADSISLILDEQRRIGLKGLPSSARREVIVVE